MTMVDRGLGVDNGVSDDHRHDQRYWDNWSNAGTDAAAATQDWLLTDGQL